jgi:hypothetical protein
MPTSMSTIDFLPISGVIKKYIITAQSHPATSKIILVM